MLGFGHNLQVSHKVELVQSLSISGGATQNLFPSIEDWLDEPENLEAIQGVSPPKSSRYKSLMDFIMCESFNKWKTATFVFYRDEKNPLRFLINEEDQIAYEESLLNLLKFAKKIQDESLPIYSWKKIIRIALERDDSVIVTKEKSRKIRISYGGSCTIGDETVAMDTVGGGLLY